MNLNNYFFKPERPFLLISESREDGISCSFLETEDELIEVVEELKSYGDKILDAIEIGSCRDINLSELRSVINMEKYLSATVVQEKLKELCKKYSVQYGSNYDSFGNAIAEFTYNLPEADVINKINRSKERISKHCLDGAVAMDYVEIILDDEFDIDNITKENKYSRWIEHNGYDSCDDYDTEYSCENCNEWVKEKSHYCPNCGAEMN